MSRQSVPRVSFDARVLAIAATMLVAIAALLAWAPRASAQEATATRGGDSGLLVTIAARSCPEYTDIMANRARNDIQESLRDLGPDSVYTNGQAINPDIEAANQPNCSPITDWDFTLGTGIKTRAVSGPWGSLSIVTNPYPTGITTQSSVPLLNSQSQPTGRTLEGAVTIELTDEQAERATRSSRLWIQGGTPTDPILNQKFPDEFGFGALRCAVDNLNGDNVEWIAYPEGANHVFCYAYYVKPPPTSGTIIVEKTVATPDAAQTTFPYKGNLTFNESGVFDLTAGGGQTVSKTFFRAEKQPGEPPWVVREDVPPGWELTDLTCRSDGESLIVTEQSTGTALINLAAGDTVTCTYTNQIEPPEVGLELAKLTLGGAGRFRFAVEPVDGGDTTRAVARTTVAGVAAKARPNPINLRPGRYRITESSPKPKNGKWVLRRVVCNGKPVKHDGKSAVVTLRASEGTACTFVNRLRPTTGSIELFKVTEGGVGRFGYLVFPRGANEVREVRSQAATTLTPGVPALARGESTKRLPFGSYLIQELGDDELWDLTSVTCNGELVPFANGRIVVELTKDERRISCTFTNTKQETPPNPPGPPGPPITPITPAPEPIPVAQARLALTKQANKRSVRLGETVTYLITVRNTGQATAQDVIVLEDNPPGAIVRSIRSSQGQCRLRPFPRACAVGDLAPGQLVRIVVRAQPTRTGLRTNKVVAGSATASETVNVHRSRELIRVLPALNEIGFTG